MKQGTSIKKNTPNKKEKTAFSFKQLETKKIPI